MNLSKLIECEICGCRILTSEQIGFLEWHPIRIYCPNCETLIEGDCRIDNDKIKCSTKFINAKNIEMGDVFTCSQYHIRTSGELITNKIKKYDKTDNDFGYTPFMEASIKMGFENFQIFKGNFLEFEKIKKTKWSCYKAILALWNKNKIELVKFKLAEEFSDDKLLLSNEVDVYKGIHKLICNVFRGFYAENINKIRLDIFKQIKEIDPTDRKEMISFFKDKNLIQDFQASISHMLDEFARVSDFLVPAYGIEYYKQKPNYKKMGTTSCSFSDIKQFYIDMYETIGNMLVLPVALDNILYRNDFNDMADDDFNNGKKIKTINQFIKCSKGKRIDFINTDEFFSKIIGVSLNNKLRNAIGHNDYEYNGIEQKIKYISSISDKSVEREIYLLEFEHECIKLMKGLLILEDILYNIKLYEYTLDDIDIDLELVLDCKVERNEKCPCGSGIKYKKCHGANN